MVRMARHHIQALGALAHTQLVVASEKNASHVRIARTPLASSSHPAGLLTDLREPSAFSIEHVNNAASI